MTPKKKAVYFPSILYVKSIKNFFFKVVLFYVWPIYGDLLFVRERAIKNCSSYNWS